MAFTESVESSKLHLRVYEDSIILQLHLDKALTLFSGWVCIALPIDQCIERQSKRYWGVRELWFQPNPSMLQWNSQF